MGVDDHTAELPLEGVGARLRRAREAAGLSRTDVARQTRIAERMLAALEEGNYAALPARAYATGFARSYARTVGLDPEAIVAEVRRDLDGSPALNERPAIPTFEPGDPARIPSRRVAWIALAALVLVLIGLAAWRSSTEQATGLPSILPPDAPPSASPVPPRKTPPAPPAPAGRVVVTAETPAWVQLSAGGRDLLKHEMKAGESFAIPADAVDPRLRTGRPDALGITIGGHPVPKLADRQTIVTNVSMTAAALLARSTPAPVPSASATPAAGATPLDHPRPHARTTPSASPAPTPPGTGTGSGATGSTPAPTDPSTATQ
jgi:cytoskeletal protein RodZ